MLALCIKYSKSALIPFDCEDVWVQDICRELNCLVARLPILYFEIPFGSNPRKESIWKEIIEKIEKRLAIWKAKLLSRAGRLVLIKTVLNCLPLYYLSIFKIPRKVAMKIIKLQRNFFWFLEANRKGIPLVSWEIILELKELGGLGVGDLIIKNAVFLFKWWWSFHIKAAPYGRRWCVLIMALIIEQICFSIMFLVVRDFGVRFLTSRQDAMMNVSRIDFQDFPKSLHRSTA